MENKMSRILEFLNIILKDILESFKDFGIFICVICIIFGMIFLSHFNPIIFKYILIFVVGLFLSTITLYVCLKIIEYLKIKWRLTDHERKD
jgi:cell division protein FtsW (lipid II flippase)